ncbi:MAG: hypothetical protein HQ559_05475 [Lentisphaerae bacterium]|nr:hypothetical protein [Lentisphaerota bacterium]
MPEQDQPAGTAPEDAESQVMEAIIGFEQILEAIPNDRSSLEALAHAYNQLGDVAKSRDYLFRLADTVITEGDVQAARDISEQLSGSVEHDEQIADLLRRINEVAGRETEEIVIPDDTGTDFNIAEELSLAWTLLQAGQVSQEDYATIVQDLTEMCAGDHVATVSVMHVIEARGFRNLEKVLGYLASDCDAPIVTLSSFELQNAVVSLVPMDFMLRRGAMPFDALGNEILVAVMNPSDKQLRKDVAKVAGRKCHFYSCLPSDFDQALDKITDVMAEVERP